MSPFAPAAAPRGGALDAESDDRSDGAVKAQSIHLENGGEIKSSSKDGSEEKRYLQKTGSFSSTEPCGWKMRFSLLKLAVFFFSDFFLGV